MLQHGSVLLLIDVEMTSEHHLSFLEFLQK